MFDLDKPDVYVAMVRGAKLAAAPAGRDTDYNTVLGYAEKHKVGTAIYHEGAPVDVVAEVWIAIERTGSRYTNVYPELRTTDYPEITPRIKAMRDRQGGRADCDCFICYAPLDVKKPQAAVHIIDGGASILHPDDEKLYKPDAGDCGLSYVGPECKKRIPKEFLHAPEMIRF